MDLGGAPADYDIGGERVFLKSDPTKGLTYAQAAQRAIELGGKFDGHESPTDINSDDGGGRDVARRHGLDRRREGQPADHGVAVPAFVAGFIEIELDTETGAFEIIDYVAVADCGTVIHPQGLATQIKGGAVMGFGLAALERHIYDPQNGLPGNVGLLQAKPATYLDVPRDVHDGRGRSARPAEPARHERHRRARHGRAARRRCCARSPMRSAATTSTACRSCRDRSSTRWRSAPQSHKPLQVNTA